jgi:hypothetical protein
MPRRNNKPSHPSAEDVRLLLLRLAEIERNWRSGADTERDAMIKQLDAVVDFLPLRDYALLYRLHCDLNELRFGFQAPYLKADKKNKGRKQESRDIQYLKGQLAGVARVQMEAGMSRREAATWVANKISPPGTRHETNVLASRVASRPVAARTVLQWMDDYDCGPQCDMEDESTRRDFERLIEPEEYVDPRAQLGRERDPFEAWVARWQREGDFLDAHTPRKKWLAGEGSLKVPGIFGWFMVMYGAAKYRLSGEDFLNAIREI